MQDVRIVPAGDAALLVEWPARIDPDINGQAVALADALRRELDPAVRDVVVGYCTVTIYFDPLRTDPEDIERAVQRRAGARLPPTGATPRVVDVDVCYGGEYGPDLADVASAAGVSEEEVIAIHSATTYSVYVVGFVPGFAYMAPVDARLALPRRGTPRPRVPAGSVAIAAGQTAIYPIETPGGWHLIGRTAARPYDPSRADPFMFRPGDKVRFHPVDRSRFERT